MKLFKGISHICVYSVHVTVYAVYICMQFTVVFSCFTLSSIFNDVQTAGASPPNYFFGGRILSRKIALIFYEISVCKHITNYDQT